MLSLFLIKKGNILAISILLTLISIQMQIKNELTKESDINQFKFYNILFSHF